MKKKKQSAPLPSKPGLSRQHLIDNFSIVPEDGNLKIGHVLHFYHENNKSVAKTSQAICAVLPVVCRIDPNHIKSIVSRFENIKNVSREKDKERFLELCKENFTQYSLTENDPTTPTPMDTSNDQPLQSDHLEPQPGCSFMPVEFRTPVSPCHSENALLSPLSLTPNLRQGQITPRKVKLKKRLQFVSKQHSAQKRKYVKRLNDLKSKLGIQKVNEKKYLNQSIARLRASAKIKNATICLLKQQLKENSKGSEKDALCKLQRTHMRLINSNKIKKEQKEKCISQEDIMKLKKELCEKDNIIHFLENRVMELEEELAELRKSASEEKQTKRDLKTYSVNTRLMVYDSIVNMVPTQNIPSLIESHAKRMGEKLTAVPHRTTVEQMARELDTIADLKTAEIAVKTPNLTLGFDATTQEHTHINSIHLTTKTNCDVVAVDELPGGTAEDYTQHVVSSVDNLADVYADFHNEDYQFCRSKIIENISNTMTDRVAVNHATIAKISEKWGKNLNELNCHLHPLDTVASSCRSSLKSLESVKGQLFGKDCIAGNLVLQINKFRYKAGKGDPKGFVTYLRDHNLPSGLIPRYRGNRLHILFHICGKFHEYYDLFLDLFTTGTVSCGGLQSCIRKDFQNETAKLQFQCLGLIGKLITGPWMQTFYTAGSAENEVNHIEGINIVRSVVTDLKKAKESPLDVLTRTEDFFNRPLSTNDCTLRSLQSEPANRELFGEMMEACLSGVITVLERQYQRYFEMDITDKLKKETLSARSHNIDAEEVMGMFGALKERAKHANMDFLVARMRAKKNGVIAYLEEMFESQKESVVNWAIGRARRKRKISMEKQAETKKEISRRSALKRQKKDEKVRKEMEKKLKTVEINQIKTLFPDISDDTHSSLKAILTGTAVGHDIFHTWYDEDTKEQTVYSGRIEKLKKTRIDKYYTVAYWSESEGYDDAVDYKMSPWALGADLICEDLVLC